MARKKREESPSDKDKKSPLKKSSGDKLASGKETKASSKKAPAARTSAEKKSTRKETAKKSEDLTSRTSIPLHKVNQIMNEILEDLFYGPDDLMYEPDLDLFESDGVLVLEVVLPGVEPGDLYLRVEPDRLILQGELLASEDYDEADAFIAERFYGPFQRLVEFPVTIDPTQTEAFYRDGILRVEMPMADDDELDYLSGQDIEIE